MVSKALSKFEELLSSDLFCRVHNKHLINLNFVNKYVKGRGGKVIMENKEEIEISEGRKAEFLKRLKKIADFLPDSKK
jgi:two-component system LytT family response regulator